MKTTILKQVQTAVQQYFVRKQFSYSTGVCVRYLQFAGYTNVVCSYVESILFDLLHMMIPLLLCRQQGEEPTKYIWNAEPPAKRLCLSSSVDALARLPKHNNGSRCLRVVNSGIHAPHPHDLRGVVKPSKPPTVLNFKHLKHLGPYPQRALSSLE